MRRKEHELFPAVREWLASRSYEIHVEVFDADVVAIKDGKLTVIELKPTCNRKLFEQLQVRAAWADFVMGAVFFPASGTAGRAITRGGLKYLGFGLLVVDGDSARQIIKPKPQPFMWHKRRASRMKKLGMRLPAQDHELAGLPACPALKSQRLLRGTET